MSARRESPEELLQAAVVRQARVFGYQLMYHTVESRLSAPGYPDLHLARIVIGNSSILSKRDIYAEIKGPRAVVSPEQERWLDALSLLGREVYVWRMSKSNDYDAQAITDVLWTETDPGPAAYGRWLVETKEVEPASLRRWVRLGTPEGLRW